MKKTITLLPVLLLIIALPAAFAATPDGTENVSTQDVWASYKEGTEGKPVISIDISWDQMSFTYSGTSVPVWNPENHRYEGETTEGGWLPGTGTVTIRNNSNALLQTAIRYNREDNYGSVDMCFTDNAPYIGSANTDDRVDAEGNVCGTPCQITLKAVPVGALPAETGEHTKIGTVSVTVDADVDAFSMLDALNDRITACAAADTADPDRGAVHFAAGTDVQALYELTEAALAACEDPDLTEAEKNVAINKALTAFYDALEIAQ